MLNNNANRLRKIRRELGMTQAKFAESIGVSNNYISEIETQKKPLSLSVMNKINDIHNINMRYMYETSEEIYDDANKIYIDIKKIFGDIKTTQQFISENIVLSGEDLELFSDKELILFEFNDCLYEYFLDIAKYEKMKKNTEIEKKDFDVMLENAKKKYREGKNNKNTQKYYLISTTQINKMIEEKIIEKYNSNELTRFIERLNQNEDESRIMDFKGDYD